MIRTVVFCAGMCVLAAAAAAGELDPPGAPAPTMKSLDEIFDKAQEALDAATEAQQDVAGEDGKLYFPGFLETSTPATDPSATDTTFNLLLTDGYRSLPNTGGSVSGSGSGDSVTVHLYLFDGGSGLPLRSVTGDTVANPHTVTLSPGSSRRIAISVQDLVESRGGFATTNVNGYAFLSIASGEWRDVAVRGLIIQSDENGERAGMTELHPEFVPNDPPAKAED